LALFGFNPRNHKRPRAKPFRSTEGRKEYSHPSSVLATTKQDCAFGATANTKKYNKYQRQESRKYLYIHKMFAYNGPLGVLTYDYKSPQGDNYTETKKFKGMHTTKV